MILTTLRKTVMLAVGITPLAVTVGKLPAKQLHTEHAISEHDAYECCMHSSEDGTRCLRRHPCRHMINLLLSPFPRIQCLPHTAGFEHTGVTLTSPRRPAHRRMGFWSQSRSALYMRDCHWYPANMSSLPHTVVVKQYNKHIHTDDYHIILTQYSLDTRAGCTLLRKNWIPPPLLSTKQLRSARYTETPACVCIRSQHALANGQYMTCQLTPSTPQPKCHCKALHYGNMRTHYRRPHPNPYMT